MFIPKYRKDIDGLRAIAVISVLLFHLDFNFFSGGYLGVDIFFVISGYLISSQIINNYNKGNFSFLEFYKRRVRRLFPALIFTILLSILISSILLVDIHYSDFKKSALFSIIGISNFYFWTTTDYFGIESGFRPLLHMWSLSVEEQFYLIWPFSLVIIFKFFKDKAFIIISLIFILGLFISEIYSGRPSGFYLPFFRFFEFVLGCLILFLEKKNYKNFFIYYLGFIIIFFSIFTYSKSTSIPGINSLIVCLGAALVILIYNSNTLIYKILTNHILVGLGKISYSLYLIHWPIFIFYSYYNIGNLNLLDKLVIIVISIIFSTAMYFYIEQPFRLKKIQAKMRILFYWSAIIVSLIFLNFSFNKSNNNHDIFTTKIIENLDEHYIVRKEKVKEFKNTKINNGNKNIYILGRSHAEDLWLSLNFNKDLFKNYNFIFLEFDFRCFVKKTKKEMLLDYYAKKIIWKSKDKCQDQITKMTKKLKSLKFEKIIFSPRWSKFVDLEKIHKTFIQFENNIIYMNRTPSFVDVPTLFLMTKNKLNFEKRAINYINLDIYDLNDKIKNFVNNTNSNYFDKFSIICPKKDVCNLLNDKHLLITDKDHYSIEGFKIFGKKMFENNISNLF